MKIGFIGQGWIGKNYADNYEARGFDTVRYSLEPEYVGNKDKISECDITFIAVPTPSTATTVDVTAVESALKCIGIGRVAVIKSTVPPETTQKLHKKFPRIMLFHSPEFLREKFARQDVDKPDRNIIGIPYLRTVGERTAYEFVAMKILKTLPEATHDRIISSTESELIKYAGNVFLTMKVIYANMLYDLSVGLNIDYDNVSEIMSLDPRIGDSHLTVNEGGRGAGGHCFIKDLEAFRQIYDKNTNSLKGRNVINALIMKNNELLRNSKKDLDLLEQIYGKRM